MKDNLLKSLKKVRWDIAFKTFGSSHHTLIGLLVEWWIAHGYGRNRYVLDEGCTFKSHKKGKGSKRCDAVLVEGNDNARGIVEVEGSGHNKTIKKMRKFFQSTRFKNLEFGIFLAYPTNSSARDGFYFECDSKKMIEQGKKITKKIKKTKLVMLFLEKEYESFDKEHLRFISSYYRGTPKKVLGTILCNGLEICKLTTIWPQK